MDNDKEEIIKAIGSVKGDIKVLKEKNDQTEKYIFKDLKPEIEKLCDKVDAEIGKLCNKVDACMEKSEECHRKNFKWMVTTMFTFAIGSIGWAGLAVML